MTSELDILFGDYGLKYSKDMGYFWEQLGLLAPNAYAFTIAIYDAVWKDVPPQTTAIGKWNRVEMVGPAHIIIWTEDLTLHANMDVLTLLQECSFTSMNSVIYNNGHVISHGTTSFGASGEILVNAMVREDLC